SYLRFFAAAFTSILLLIGAFLIGPYFYTTSAQASQTINADLNAEYFANADSAKTSNKNSDTSKEDGNHNQLAQAQPESNSLQNSNNQCTYITDNLRIDFTNDQEQVLRLQAFLKAYAYDYVELTGSFDESTLQAVRAFQARHADDILSPWGYESDEATGYVYITTRQKINEIYCNEDVQLTSEQTAEIQQYRNKLSRWRQEGASFETPEYLRQYNPQLAAQTAPTVSNQNNQGSVAGEEDTTVAQADQDTPGDSSENTDDQTQNNEESATTTDENEDTATSADNNQDENGFFDRLFGNDDGNDEVSTSSQDGQVAATSTEDLNSTNTTSAATNANTSDNNTDLATSIDNAATTVHSGVNSAVGFLLSPTFLLVLLGLLILLLIATLLEDDNDRNDTDEDALYGFDPDDDDDDFSTDDSADETNSKENAETNDASEEKSTDETAEPVDTKTRSAEFDENDDKAGASDSTNEDSS
ncbi:MAG: hypothetical protein BRC24_01040, partial [Parcubacteria group bacterium SW_4_46_8]